MRDQVEERRERWDAMMKALEAAPLQGWFADFITALRAPAPDLEAAPESATLLTVPPRTRQAGGLKVMQGSKSGQNLVNSDPRH